MCELCDSEDLWGEIFDRFYWPFDELKDLGDHQIFVDSDNKIIALEKTGGN